MNNLEFDRMIDDMKVMIDALKYDLKARKDVMTAIYSIEQKNIFWMVDSIRKLRFHIENQRYILNDEDKLWIKETSFHVSDLQNACETVLIKCGWVFDFIKYLYKKTCKIDSYNEYIVELDKISKNCCDIPMEAIVVKNFDDKYETVGITKEYLEHFNKRLDGYYVIAEDWNKWGFKKESALLFRFWEDMPIDIKMMSIVR
jgi:thymidine kinase